MNLHVTPRIPLYYLFCSLYFNSKELILDVESREHIINFVTEKGLGDEDNWNPPNMSLFFGDITSNINRL